MACILGLLFSCQEDKVTPDLFGSLSGEVIFDTDGLPVDGATISTIPSTSTLLSGLNGNFEFETIKEGTFSIRAELAGYQTAIESVTITEGQTSTVVLKMKLSLTNNQPPPAANSPSPMDGSIIPMLSTELTWDASDPDEDELNYDVYVFDSQQQSEPKAENLTVNSFLLENLRYGTKYYWQVVVKDGVSNPVFGEVWEFTTPPFPNHSFVFSKINNSVYEIYSGGIVNEFYQLTTGGSNYRPKFSPLGSRIAFINANYPEKRLFTMKRDGSELSLVETPIPIDGPNDFQLNFTWSPDGTSLLYMRGKRLYKIKIDGTGHQLFAELADEEFIEVDWSKVGNKVAARTVGDFPYQSRILIYNENGDFIQEAVPDGPGSIGGPSFSIDGNSILFTRDTTGIELVEGRQFESHVFLKNLNTGVISDLSHDKPDGFNDLEPRFSPNGALIIFTQTNNFPNSQKDLFIMTNQGEGRQKLFENSEMADWRN